MFKSFKVRLEPNNKQKSRLIQFAGAARFAYNWALEQEIKNYEQGDKFIQEFELRKKFTEFKKENIWLYNISNDVLKQGIIDAVDAYKKFFKGGAKHPRFKSKKNSKQSFYQDNAKIDFTEDKVKLEKITTQTKRSRKQLNWIKLSEKLRILIKEKYVNPRITFDGIHWYVSVGIKYSDSQNKPKGNGIGIDLGVKDLAICSDGNIYKNINKTEKVRKLEKSKRRKQRQTSRKYKLNKQGSKYVKTKNIEKAEKQLLKINHAITNIRENYIHQVASEIIKREPSFIVLEDLNISGMMKNRHLSRALQNQSLYKFKQTLKYKAEQNNIQIIEVDRFYPSSKTCSCCGAVKSNLKLSERVFVCNECGFEIDRDFNASLNLYNLGNTARTAEIYACGVLKTTEVVFKTKQNTMKQEINIKSKRLL